MSTANAALSRRWFQEVWNDRRTETIWEMMAPEGVGHMEGVEVVGPEGFRPVHAAFLDALPDLHIEVEGIVADGDEVVVRWRATGTHDGDGLGVPRTGSRVEIRGMTWHRYEGGKMVEGWDCWNHGALVSSLRDAASRTTG
jgi:steroid delta-isomerase-like uncharacterized protein